MKNDRQDLVICWFVFCLFFLREGLEIHLKFSIRARRQRKLRISLGLTCIVNPLLNLSIKRLEVNKVQTTQKFQISSYS